MGLPQPGVRAWALRGGRLAVAAGLLCGAGGVALAQAATDPLVGRWVSLTGNEGLEIKPTGYLRNCFIGDKPGSASMGAWTRTAPGRYRIEFTHAVSRGCNEDPRMLRRYDLSIVGHATVGRANAGRDELALYLSGEFPPDRFVRDSARAR